MAYKGERTPLLASGYGWPTVDSESTISESDAGEWEFQEEKEKTTYSTKVVLAMFLPMTIGIFLVAADGAMVVSSYAAIGSEMKQLQKTSWISTGYLLTMTSFQPMYGRLSLIFGKKQTLLFAYTVFTLGSLLSGVSRNMKQLVLARALAGVGGGGLSILPTIILTDVIDLKSRGTWQGILNLVYSIGSAVGGPLGGHLADYMGWRWSFLLQVPAMVFALLMVYLTLHIQEPLSSPKSEPHFEPSKMPTYLQTLNRLDLLGALTLILAVSSLLLTLQRLSEMCLNFFQLQTWFPLLLSISLFLFFLFIEFYLATSPILPKHLILSNPSLLATYLSNFFGSGASMSLFFHFSLYLQVVRGKTPTEAGVGLLPSVVGVAVGSLVGGLVIKKTGGFYLETLVGYGTLLAGCLGVAIGVGVGDVDIGLGILEASFAIAGYGTGHAITTSLIALISAAGTEDQAIATSVSYLFRSLGSALSISLGNALVQSVLLQTLKNKIPLIREGEGENVNVMDLVRLLTSSLSSLSTLDPSTQEIVREAYKVALRSVFILTCALALCAVGCAAMIRRRRVG